MRRRSRPRHSNATPGGGAVLANRWETADADRRPALRCVAAGGRDHVEKCPAEPPADASRRALPPAATRSTPAVNHHSTIRAYSVSEKGVTPVDAVDTFVG